MTLFEYVLRKYIGTPAPGNKWACLNPNHPDSNPSMGIQPPTAAGKVRCKCYACGFYGDVYDILKILHPLESFPEQQLRVRDLQNELTAMQGNNGSFSQGTPEARHKATVSVVAGNIWADYRDIDGFESSLRLIERCKRDGITVEDVIEYDMKHRRSMDEMERNHILECDDPECDACVCRNARGLPPLTPEEIELDRRELRQAIVEQQARIEKAFKRARRM